MYILRGTGAKPQRPTASCSAGVIPLHPEGIGLTHLAIGPSMRAPGRLALFAQDWWAFDGHSLFRLEIDLERAEARVVSLGFLEAGRISQFELLERIKIPAFPPPT